jgi:hypothetical protein
MYFKRNLFIIFTLFLSLLSSYSYIQDTSPLNNSILTSVTQSITTTISGSENVSTFIDWNNTLLGYWNFDFGNSSHTFDLSSYGNDGEYISGTTNSDTDKIRGNYSTLRGYSNDSIKINPSSLYNNFFENGGSVSFWVNPSAGLNQDFVVSVGNLTDTQWYINIRNDGFGSEALQFGHLFTSNSAYWIIDEGISINEWTHIVVTYNRSSITNKPQFYSNTVLNVSYSTEITPIGTPSSSSNFTHLTFGIRERDMGWELVGGLDEVILFDRIISQDEINALYNSQVYNFNFTPENLQDNTQYNYTIYSNNFSGFYLNNKNTFLINTSYIFPIFTDTSSSIFPQQSGINILILFSSLFLFLFF